MINRLFALIMSLLFTFIGSPTNTGNLPSDNSTVPAIYESSEDYTYDSDDEEEEYNGTEATGSSENHADEQA